MRVVLLILCLLLALPADARAAEIVRVGGYEFPPFVEAPPGGTHKGLALDLIAALNGVQTRYDFRFVPVAARRRYAELESGAFDVMFFESPEWDWARKKLPVDFSPAFLRGGEVYIAAARPGRGEEYFAELKGKRLVGILGYHYGLAQFVADPDVLARDFGMKLVTSHRSSIEMVLADRADVAVVTDSFLWAYLSANPQARDRLLVSERYDQIYNHRALVRRSGPIDLATMTSLLGELERNGTLDRLWQAAGVVKR